MQIESTIEAPSPGAVSMDGLQTRLPSAPVSFLRLIGLAIAALAMVLLLTTYLAAAGLLGYVLYWYGVGHFPESIGFNSVGDVVCLYAAPLVIGIVWLIFMLKPFFAQSPKPPQWIQLTPENEPVLFEFLQKLCQCIGAPMPRIIKVDVPASVEVLPGNVLKIGLPLAAGLTSQQFAQVLSHELFHFAQGTGTRLQQLIQRINAWLDHAVNGRDRIDLWLERNAQRTELTVFLPLRIAQQCVWLSRHVLWLWLKAGQAVSSYFSRQSELDADAVSCRVVGSDCFVDGSRCVSLLQKATTMALDHATASWKSRRLPEDLAGFAARRSEAFTTAEAQEFQQAVESGAASWVDPTPAWTYRERQASSLAAPGVFHATESASLLLQDLPALSRAATRNYYESERGLKIEDGFLVSLDESLQEYLAEVESNRALNRYLGGLDTFFYPVAIHVDEIRTKEDAETLRMQLVQARERLRNNQEATAKALGRLKRLDDRLSGALCARALAESGISFRTRAYRVPGSSFDDISEHIKELKRQIEPLEKTAADFSRDVKLRLLCALQLLRQREGPDGNLSQDAERLAETSGRLVSSLWIMHEVRRSFRAFETLIEKRLVTPNPERLDKVLDGIAADGRLALKKVKQHLYSAPYPFPHARGEITLATFLKTEFETANETEAVCLGCEAHLDRLFFLYNRILARLSEIGERAEREVGE